MPLSSHMIPTFQSPYPSLPRMEMHGRACNLATPPSEEDMMDLRRGPWTVEEDILLMNYITNHGEGRWNALAHCAGLKRTGKSCRLRWLNYLRPDVRRGNITPEEQLLILELHSRWGNRWSKIAQHLPGRTDNEIKNYWRTRVQKHAKQLRCDVDSKKFKDVMRYLWMPRLLERIQAASAAGTSAAAAAVHQQQQIRSVQRPTEVVNLSPESCSMGGPSTEESVYTAPDMDVAHEYCLADYYGVNDNAGVWWPEALPSPGGYAHLGFTDSSQEDAWGDVPYEELWSLEDIWSQQKL